MDFRVIRNLFFCAGAFALPSIANAESVRCEDEFGRCSVQNEPYDFVTCECDDGAGTGGTGGDAWQDLDAEALADVCKRELGWCADSSNDTEEGEESSSGEHSNDAEGGEESADTGGSAGGESSGNDSGADPDTGAGNSGDEASGGNAESDDGAGEDTGDSEDHDSGGDDHDPPHWKDWMDCSVAAGSNAHALAFAALLLLSIGGAGRRRRRG